MYETLKELYEGVTSHPSSPEHRQVVSSMIYDQLGNLAENYPRAFKSRLWRSSSHEGVSGKLFLLPNGMAIAEINGYNQFDDNPAVDNFRALRLRLTELGDGDTFFNHQFNSPTVREADDLAKVTTSQLDVVRAALAEVTALDPIVASRYRSLRYSHSSQ